VLVGGGWGRFDPLGQCAQDGEGSTPIYYRFTKLVGGGWGRFDPLGQCAQDGEGSILVYLLQMHSTCRWWVGQI
jgi:hypothetical protein